MLDTVFNILKVTVIIAICAVFSLAILSLLNLITSIVFGNVIGEFFALISMYMPFDCAAIFGSFALAVTAIFSFLIAKKIFDLTSWSVSSI